MTIVVAGVITLVGTIAIFVITFWLIARGKPAESSESIIPRLYRVRSQYFLVVSLVLAVMLFVTLRDLPYRNMVTATPEYVVPVIGRIWSWEIGPVRKSNGDPLQSEPGTTVLPHGVPVEFQVTAMDVNHGFGIYDEAGRLVAQTQAMPGYANHLVHTFTEAGTYQVLCMEFCGIGHHVMFATITVE